MDIKEIEVIAEGIRKQLGGTIFAFPVNSEDPHSKYAVTVFTGSEYRTFAKSVIIEDAASGILGLLEGYKEVGLDNDYDRNVRLISYEAQMKAPNITMHKLRTGTVKNPNGFKLGEDYHDHEGEEKLISARGLIKMSYILVIDDKNPKASIFMDGYYALLSLKKYGKTAAAIKQEVRKLNKDKALKWLEQTYSKYIKDDMEVFALMKNVRN